MPTKKHVQEAAALLGRLGGLAGGPKKSASKTAAARRNGRKGGWPKGKSRKIAPA